MSQRTIPFKVDVAGVIHIMGTALYSRPDAAVRELLQNAHDAIIRRRRKDLRYKGRIDVAQDARSGTLEFTDDGIGLNADEAEQYLGTLGIGVTGLLKGVHPAAVGAADDGEGLIGQFGIGLFSAFLLADDLVVESRRAEDVEGIRWQAGAGTEILLGACPRAEPGTTVRLRLKPEARFLAESPETLESVIRQYADFLTIPIHLNGAEARVNVVQAGWFEPTIDTESLPMELESYFGETPLDVIPIRSSRPVRLVGALYVTPQRTPGFSDAPVVMATVRRMVISRKIQDLLPDWASFLRGVIEFPDGTPTASREDLVRDDHFTHARATIEHQLLAHFTQLAANQPERLEAVLSWHRYGWAGAGLTHRGLRDLLRTTYKFPTSVGPLTFTQILEKSTADPLHESEFDHVIWYQTDRRQERWMNTLFTRNSAPCVHALRSFEESLLAAMASDEPGSVDLRFASPSVQGFAHGLLGIQDLEDAPLAWQEFLSETGARVFQAEFRDDLPVMAFLNEKHELLQTFEDLKQQGVVPGGFQRLIDRHFEGETARNEVVLNRRHRLVGRAMEQSTATPLAAVLRLLVINALGAAGAAVPRAMQRQQAEDLDWIAEALWGRTV